MTTRETEREGWYTDPLGHADLRWWDSRNWTEHVTAARQEGSRPTTAPRPAPTQWADDELPGLEPTGSTNHVSPPTVWPLAPPKFALGATAEEVSTKPEPAVPVGPDWSELTLALLAAGDNIVTASAAAIPTITIDMVGRSYWWESSLDSFPAHPVDLIVRSTPRADAVIPAVAGRFVEPLLWRVGTGAETLLGRVDPALRYKLRRWPDLASMPHTADQLRAITMLASAQLTATELGAVADITEREVRVLISTFALMSLLDAVQDPAAKR